MSKIDAVVSALQPAIAAAAMQAMRDSPALDAGDAAQITHDVTKEVAAVVINQTNQEPWYQSNVTLAAIVAALAGLLGMFGFTMSVEDQAFWVANLSQAIQLGTAVAAFGAGVWAWYGRWRAKKPLGH